MNINSLCRIQAIFRTYRRRTLRSCAHLGVAAIPGSKGVRKGVRKEVRKGVRKGVRQYICPLNNNYTYIYICIYICIIYTRSNS